MPPEVKPDANAAPSPANNDNPPSPGSKQDAPSLENLVGENKRLREKLEKLQADYDDDKLSLGEMQEKLEKLMPKESNEDPISKARKDPNNKLAVDLITSLIEEMFPKKYQELRWKDGVEGAKNFISDKAEELGIDPKDLAKTLKKYAVDYDAGLPMKRKYALAFREYMKDQKEKEKSEARLNELEQAKDDEGAFNLNGNRKSSADLKDKFNKVKEAQESGDHSALMESLNSLT